MSVPSSPRLVAVRRTDGDTLAVLTWLAVGGLVLGAALALFGMPPVELHGPQHDLGLMSPTCGATRSVAHALRGQLLSSVRYNPLGIVLVGGAVGVLVRAMIGRTTGRWWQPVTERPVLLRWLAVIGFLALWANQQAAADLLMRP